MCGHATSDGVHTDKGIVLRGVTKRIHGKTVLDGVTAEFPRGEISGVRGHNGSGKTMLLRAVAGLIRIDEGEVRVLGRDVARGDTFPESMGFLIEPMKLWDDLTGFQNLRMLASIRGAVGQDEIENALRRVGLDPEDKRRVKSYSLGMHQRLCIAQAIMERPAIILLDEPTNALDDVGRCSMRGLLLEEKRRGATIVIVSHDAAELDAVADHRFEMSEGAIRKEW